MIGIYRNIIRNIKEDGLIINSSGFLATAMAGKIDFSRADRILEIGSGKGAITREIIQRMPSSCELDICEIKSEYNLWIELLKVANEGKRINILNGCVTEVLPGRDEYDVIVSSLPLKNFSSAGNNAFLYRVIETLRDSLKPGGTFLQYQYFMSNKADIETVFGKPVDTVSFVPFNILPAFIYQMTKPALAYEMMEPGAT